MHEGPHGTMHWSCCWGPWLGKILWWVAFLSLVGGLLAYWRGGQFMNVTVPTWYWNALVGGVLALGAKVFKPHGHWHETQG